MFGVWQPPQSPKGEVVCCLLFVVEYAYPAYLAYLDYPVIHYSTQPKKISVAP